MRRIRQIATIIILLLSGIKNAVAQQKNTLVIEDDHLLLQIDLQSPAKEIDSVLAIAGLRGSGAEKILKGDYTCLSNDGWNVAGRENSLIRFDRSLSDLNDNPQSKPYLITARMPQLEGKPGFPDQVKYGVNKFAKIMVFGLSSGLTRFILPGYPNAKRVFLSGNFNNWSTLRGLMKRLDGGWIIDLKLNAGAYEYKYIVDGRWMTDPNNLVQVNDGAGNINSAFFKYNYTFQLRGHSLAHRVLVAGSFNDWDANELIMQKKDDIWQLQMYLADGSYAYRFMVDGQWLTDPANPVTTKDETGILSSVLNLGETVTFQLSGYRNASDVSVAGDFNGWKSGELKMKKKGDSWVLPMVLTGGNYNYRFIVGGKWMTDPENPHYGVENGVTNSFIAVKPNHTFKLKGYGSAKTVVLTGSFDNWDPTGHTMAHIGDEWVIDLNLKPGKYLYKFRVDGQWILDPGNKLWEQNEFNTGNSVLWIE